MLVYQRVNFKDIMAKWPKFLRFSEFRFRMNMIGLDGSDGLNGPQSVVATVLWSSFIAFVWLRFPLSGSQKGPSCVII